MRDTDPVEIPSAAGILILGLPQDPQLGTIATLDPTMAAHLRQARRSFQDPVVAARARRLAARANMQIPTGLPNTEALIDALGMGLARRTIIGMFLPRAPLGQQVGMPAPKPGPTPLAAFAGMSPEQRIRLLLERTPKELGPDLARAFRSMVTVEALAGIAAAFAVLLAAQFIGVGEIADAALAWWAYSQAGFAGLTGLYKALRAVVACVRATTEGEFDQAVKHFAEGLTLVGIALLTAVVTRAARRRAGGAEGGGGAGDDAAPSSTRSKVGRASADTEASRMAVARAYYERTGWPADRIDAQMAGIDPSQDVSVVTLKQGQTVTQYTNPERGTGNYFAPAGTTPGELGISGEGRTLQTYTVTQDTEVLQSTAAPVTDTWSGPAPVATPGGGTQWFAADKSVFQPTGGPN